MTKNRQFVMKIKYRTNDHPFYKVGVRTYYDTNKSKLKNKLFEFMERYWVISFTIKKSTKTLTYVCCTCQNKKDRGSFKIGERECKKCCSKESRLF